MDRDAKETVPKKKQTSIDSIDRVESSLAGHQSTCGRRARCALLRWTLQLPRGAESQTFTLWSLLVFIVFIVFVFNRIHFFSGETWILYDYTHVLLSALPCLIKHPLVCFVPGWRCMVCISRTGPSHQEIESVSSSGDARLSSCLSSVELGWVWATTSLRPTWRWSLGEGAAVVNGKSHLQHLIDSTMQCGSHCRLSFTCPRPRHPSVSKSCEWRM